MVAMTIFCHGTKSFSDERSLDPVVEAQGELVQLLEKYFRMPDDRQALTLNGGKLLLQGVGSAGHDPLHSGLQDEGATLALVDRQRLVPAWGKAVTEILHQLGGAGVGDNIDRAVTFLKAMRRERMAPDSINMLGWSRGAVTCVRLAQALDREVPDIPVHIFAGDPVPGFGRHEGWGGLVRGNKEYTITRNVRTFLHVIAMDVRGMMGPLFRPLLPGKVEGGDTIVAMIPMPGDHSEVVKTAFGEPGELTMDLAIRFLEMNDSAHLDPEFVRYRRLAMPQILNRYQAIMRDVGGDDGAYPVSHAYQADGATRRTRPGEFSQLSHYTGPDFENDFRSGRFVNFHHRFVQERMLGIDALQLGSAPEDFGLRTLLTRMYA